MTTATKSPIENAHDTLPVGTLFRIQIDFPDYDDATDWRRTWNETQSPETLHNVFVSRVGSSLVFNCNAVSAFTAVSGFIARLHS